MRPPTTAPMITPILMEDSSSGVVAPSVCTDT